MLIRVACGIFCGIAPFLASAHHSYTEFDSEHVVEIEGTLTLLSWQNPHTHLQVQGVDSANRAITWDIEAAGVNGLRRRGAEIDELRVGTHVKVAGWASKRSPERMYATNLLAGDTEVVAQQGVARRWTSEAAESNRLAAAQGLGPPVEPTLFRVWSSDPAIDPRTRTGFLTRAVVSLTERATREVAAFDPVSQSTTDGCRPKGMPDMMGQPFPIEFEDQGDTIVLSIEEYDARRTIHMKNESAAARPRSRLGYSAGRWEEGALVVVTDQLDSPFFNSKGIRLTESARIVERFSVSDDGRVLSYELTADDPAIFTAPARANRVWLAKDGERVMPFECKEARQ